MNNQKVKTHREQRKTEKKIKRKKYRTSGIKKERKECKVKQLYEYKN